MSASAAKVYIQIESDAEQQEHLKQQRKTLKPILGNVNDKENITGRVSIVDQLSRLKAGVNATPKYGKRKCMETGSTAQLHDADTQTDATPNDADKPITVDDLTSVCEAGENYYKRLAETRREALETTLKENQHLHERIEGLEEEMGTLRKELDEAKCLVEMLKEIIDEDQSGEEDEQRTDEDNAAQVE
ncbi:uncharacterized protein LOC115624610 [Scaptodrosophila lebanonensis]|uniref:Uncharacterized protein LOC115624610 n=1 Tax=Drosophila lebanonensis TaxID=7225 RepID=A0A6J2TEN5_DROLE|nr:uncharacterized protein LOC115624610 [Scaptodrosophila lebanonensis]